MKVISAATMSKLVGFSLNLAKLKIIHKRDPNNGIRNVFSDPIANSRRCIGCQNQKQLLRKLCNIFQTSEMLLGILYTEAY